MAKRFSKNMVRRLVSGENLALAIALGRTQLAKMGDFINASSIIPVGDELLMSNKASLYQRIMMLEDKEIPLLPYPFFLMRRPDTTIRQDEILFADTSEDNTWYSRMARPETYMLDDDGNVIATTVATEKGGDVDWVGWDGLSLTWDGYRDPPVREELPYGGLNNRYFFNYAMAGAFSLTLSVDVFASRLYFNGIGFSTIANFMGGAISTVTVDGEQGTYAHYITYFPGTSTTRAIRIFRRPFDSVTGRFTSFPQLRNSFLVGTGSGRNAGPFHFNASGTVAKGLATKKQVGSDLAGGLHIVTFTIDPATGNITVESESAVTEAFSTQTGGVNMTLDGSEYPADPFTEFLITDCDNDSLLTNGFQHFFKIRTISKETRGAVREGIMAVDFVGDEPVYLRIRHETAFSRDINAATPHANLSWYTFPNAGPAPEPNLGEQCQYGPATLVEPPSFSEPKYARNNPRDDSFGWADDVILDEDTFGMDEREGNMTETNTTTTRITIEGAYEATIFDELFHETVTVKSSGLIKRTGSVDRPAKNQYEVTINRNREVLPSTFFTDVDTVFLGLDLRNNSFIHRQVYRDAMESTVEGGASEPPFVDEIFPFTEKTDITYRYAALDEGVLAGKNAKVSGSRGVDTAIYAFLPAGAGWSGSYNESTGEGRYEFDSATAYTEFMVQRWDDYFGRPSYEPAALAAINFDVGVINSSKAILYSFTIDQSDADDPVPNEVYAGIVCNIDGMNRTQEELRELFGDGAPSYATQNLEQDFRPVRFGGFNVPFTIPYP